MSSQPKIKPVLAFDEHEGCLLIAAADVIEGDEVCFRWPGANYIVDGVDTTAIGTIRHQHHEGTASSCYDPGELLWVRTKRARRLGHLTKVEIPPTPPKATP